MWKVFMIMGMPLMYPFLIIYGLAMNILMPLGVPDFLGLMM